MPTETFKALTATNISTPVSSGGNWSPLIGADLAAAFATTNEAEAAAATIGLALGDSTTHRIRLEQFVVGEDVSIEDTIPVDAEITELVFRVRIKAVLFRGGPVADSLVIPSASGGFDGGPTSLRIFSTGTNFNSYTGNQNLRFNVRKEIDTSFTLFEFTANAATDGSGDTTRFTSFCTGAAGLARIRSSLLRLEFGILNETETEDSAFHAYDASLSISYSLPTTPSQGRLPVYSRLRIRQ